MRYTVQHIATIVSGSLKGQTSGFIEHLLLDSRQVIFPQTALFFALVGKRHDGHHYIGQLYAEGLRHFVVSKPLPWSDYPEASFIQVEDTLKGLQQLAYYHRHQFPLKTIGITGSNGKTIVKEWLFDLLHLDFRIVRSPKSYNSQIGVPLSVWQIRPEHNLGIFEAGISEMGEMERISPIIDCQIGIFTNIGEAHAAGFPSKVEKVKQKLRLFDHAQTLIYCKDYPVIHQEVSKLDKNTFSWSRKEKADLQITGIHPQSQWQTRIEGFFAQKAVSILLPFTDEASIENAIHCWALLLKLGFPMTVIQERMLQLEPVGMRLQLIQAVNQCTLINDSYNSDLNALHIALNFLEQQKQQNNSRTLILSDILQSGQDEVQLYQKVAGLLKEKKINRLFAIGTAIECIRDILDKKIEFRHFPDTDNFLQQLQQIRFDSETILLKGARHFQFERIAEQLSLKVHQTTLEVNLSALSHNLNVYHSYLQPDTKMMVMVKAAAYGSGSVEIARLLEFSKVDYLAVAYADEGVELRKQGITLPIMVLNPEEAVFDVLLRYRLEPEIYSLRLLEKFTDFVPATIDSFPVHIKLETGMHRLGFEEADLDQVAHLMRASPSLSVQSVFSHLAASEAPEHDAFTRQQIDRFHRAYEHLSALLGYRPLRHILNSSGINRFPEHQMDMVRLGIGLYGIDSSDDISSRLREVLRLKARISQIKTLDIGQTVGYGRAGKANKKMTIATVSIGYADGLPRVTGNRKHHLYVKGKPAPVIGNVCMDMCMIDISQISSAKEGDEVIIFESVEQINDLAKAVNTIPYELLTNISPRVKRVYIQE